MSKKVLLSLTLCVAINASILTQAFAEEIVVSGNGDGSSNEVHIDSEQNTNVTQTNNADINNDIENNSNTGNNTVNDNSGEANIQTGNTDSTINVSNDNINTNIADVIACCDDGGNTYIIENNGADSNNSIDSQIGNSITSNQTNNATIQNNITLHLNTGDNTANDNSGNVIIKTGNITSAIIVNNNNINTSIQNLALGSPSINALINGNGTNSNNNLSLNIARNITSNINNNSNILNNIFAVFNTGGNTANGNLGNVFIETGNILSLIDINNTTNFSFTHADCECEQNPPPVEPTPTITPPPSPTGKPCVDNCGSSNPTNGSVAGASSGPGQTLPATGNYLLFLLTLASLITFFSGWYLRFRSGLAPGGTNAN